jgi:hypothetical protein
VHVTLGGRLREIIIAFMRYQEFIKKRFASLNEHKEASVVRALVESIGGEITVE